MPSRPAVDSFTQSWSKTVNWAKQNNIPYSAYYPVYQLDSQRLLTGAPMSESERIRAIQASFGMNYSTALPTDNPSWTDLRGNSIRNAQGIFTGLNPIHLAGNIFDTIKNTVEHPSTVTDVIGDIATGNLGAAGRKLLEPNNILDFAPGVYDLATVFANDPHLTGSKGFEALAHNPISSVLDVLPFGRIASETTVRGAVGGALEERLGLSQAELRKAGIWRVGGKFIKSTPAPNALTKTAHPFLLNHVDPETNKPVNLRIDTSPTIGDLWDYYKTKVGAGSEQAKIIEARMKANRIGTQIVEQIAKPALKKLEALNPEMKGQLVHWAQTDLRPLEDKMHDESVPIEVRDAYAAAYHWGNALEQMRMQAGEVVTVESPWKDENGNPIMEHYYVDTPQYGNVRRALDESKKAQEAYDKSAAPITGLLYKIDENDTNVMGAFAVMEQLRPQVWNSIQKSLPGATTDQAERMSATLPSGGIQTIPGVKAEAFMTKAERDSPNIRSMLGLPPAVDAITKRMYPELAQDEKVVSLHQVNALRDLYAPGGLIDKAIAAYNNQDWAQLRELTKAANRKFRSDSLKSAPRDGAAVIHKSHMLMENLQKYADERKKLTDEAQRRMEGTKNGKRDKKAYRQSTGYLAEKAYKTHQNWINTAIKNPPDVWRNLGMEIFSTKIAQEEMTAANVEDTHKQLSFQGWSDSTLTKMHQDERTILELMANVGKATMENNMLPDIDHAEANRTMDDMYSSLASLRARGQKPLYVHMLTPDQAAHIEPTFDVYIRGVNVRKPGGSKHSVWGYTGSVYDIGAGLLQDTKDMVERDMMDAFINQELKPRLLPAADVQSLITNYYKTEYDALLEHNIALNQGEHPGEDTLGQMGIDVKARTEVGLGILQRGLSEFGLVSFDKGRALFGEGFSHPNLNSEYYIHADLLDAFKQSVDKFQFPAQSIVDRGTKLFRFSILGLSPRYTAHILFGGTYMLALRGHASMLKYIPDAVYFAVHGSFNDKTYERFHPDFVAEMKKVGIAGELSGESTEEGLAAAQFHYVTMNHAGRNWLIPEWMDRHGLEDTTMNRIKATANLNMNFTRAIRRAQNAVVYLDGAARALKDGTSYYHNDLVGREAVNPDDHPDVQVDAQGRNVHHPVTKKQIFDVVRSKSPMTPQQAHVEGMHAVAEVMGNLRHMTPLERNLLARVFPFYGWTKHVLQYVMSYPFDHPYRAFIISQLAMQNQEDIASGLPQRIGLLTFLGSPDQYGNVTALDTKPLDPFRDTANYASLVGLFESLNPAITGFGALVDPQFSFAGQNLYPQVTFNSLYGTKTAGAGGNIFTAGEQFIPQLTAIDAAFNLSGQYAYLAKSNPSAFSKKVFESLGLPFTPQHLNLRQISAKQEIDRYQQAEAAGRQVAAGVNPDALAGYAPNAQIPDPLNAIYNVTPAYIQAMEKQSEKQYGLPFTETATPPRTPAGL